MLNIGLELGVISPQLFAMMVIMALTTTIATTPILRALTESSFAEHLRTSSPLDRADCSGFNAAKRRRDRAKLARRG